MKHVTLKCFSKPKAPTREQSIHFQRMGDERTFNTLAHNTVSFQVTAGYWDDVSNNLAE